MRIKEIMSKPAVTCGARDTLDQAARAMWKHDCGALPVTKLDGTLVGMITDRDICMAACMHGSTLRDIRVATAMAKDVFSCHANDMLEKAEAVMSERQVRRLPVVDAKNHPVGVISLNDIARKAAKARETDDLEHELTMTMAAICEPHTGALQTH